MNSHDVAAAILLANHGAAPAVPVIIPPKGDEPGNLSDFERDVVNARQERDYWASRCVLLTAEFHWAREKLVEWEEDIAECQRRLNAAKERGVR